VQLTRRKSHFLIANCAFYDKTLRLFHRLCRVCFCKGRKHVVAGQAAVAPGAPLVGHAFTHGGGFLDSSSRGPLPAGALGCVLLPGELLFVPPVNAHFRGRPTALREGSTICTVEQCPQPLPWRFNVCHLLHVWSHVRPSPQGWFHDMYALDPVVSLGLRLPQWSEAEAAAAAATTIDPQEVLCVSARIGGSRARCGLALISSAFHSSLALP
jgi:hypothetical protein